MTTTARKVTKKKVAKSKGITSLQANKDKVTAEIKFNRTFKKANFKFFSYEFSVKDLPLIEHICSQEVNSNNRVKSDDNTRRLYRSFLANEWYPEASIIAVSKQGELINGQHTFDAMNQFFNTSKATKNKKVLVHFFLGVNPKAMPYWDTAKKRSPHQNLTIKHNGYDIGLNRIQKEIVLTEGKNIIHGSPFVRFGQVNFFEYENVIKKHSSMLDRVFGNRVFCVDFPYKAIGYALFCVAKEDEELADTIITEICDYHNHSKQKFKLSDYKDALEEHPIIEEFRRQKMLKMKPMTSKTSRDCYRAEEFYPKATKWLSANYDIDSKIFPK